MAEAVLKNRAEADAAIRRLLLSRDELQQKFDRMAQRFPEKLQTVKSVTNFVVLRTPYAKELYERLWPNPSRCGTLKTCPPCASRQAPRAKTQWSQSTFSGSLKKKSKRKSGFRPF